MKQTNRMNYKRNDNEELDMYIKNHESCHLEIDVLGANEEMKLFEIRSRYLDGDRDAINEVFDWSDNGLVIKSVSINQHIKNAIDAFGRNEKNTDKKARWRKSFASPVPKDEIEMICQICLELMLTRNQFVIKSNGDISDINSVEKKSDKIIPQNPDAVTSELEFFKNWKYAIILLINRKWECKAIECAIPDESSSSKNEGDYNYFDNRKRKYERALCFEEPKFTSERASGYQYANRKRLNEIVRGDYLNSGFFTKNQQSFLKQLSTLIQNNRTETLDRFFYNGIETLYICPDCGNKMYEDKRSIFVCSKCGVTKSESECVKDSLNKKEIVHPDYFTFNKENAYRYLGCSISKLRSMLKQLQKQFDIYLGLTDDQFTYKTQYLATAAQAIYEAGMSFVFTLNKDSKTDLAKSKYFKLYVRNKNRYVYDTVVDYCSCVDSDSNAKYKELFYQAAQNKSCVVTRKDTHEVMIYIARCLAWYLCDMENKAGLYLDNLRNKIEVIDEYKDYTILDFVNNKKEIYKRVPDSYKKYVMRPWDSRENKQVWFSYYWEWKIEDESDQLIIYKWVANNGPVSSLPHEFTSERLKKAKEVKKEYSLGKNYTLKRMMFKPFDTLIFISEETRLKVSLYRENRVTSESTKNGRMIYPYMGSD